MLDQTFSVQNLRRIYDHENRRGRNVDRAFFPELVEASAKIGAKSERIRELRKINEAIDKDALQAILAPVYAELHELRKTRESMVDSNLEQVAASISSKSFNLKLNKVPGPGGIYLYPMTSSANSYFVGKQLQRNINRLYKVRPGDRRMIISQLLDILTTGFPMYVVKTDISGFYESIERSKLLKEIDHDQLLSLSSKSHIKCVLSEFGNLSGSQLGIPRGVGVSSYLSELYMRSIDQHISQIPGISYYARYVDDIIAIFSPAAMDDVTTYFPEIAAALAIKGLSPNLAKSKEGPTGSGSVLNFEYLGYMFNVAGGACRLEMSSRKFLRYKSRIDYTFDAFDSQAAFEQKAAFRLMASRIKFLTGNTRLVNNKRHAYVGIYYSNSHLTESGRLNALDAYLSYRISKLSSAGLQNSLDRFSFRRGFDERPFYRYSTQEMTEITRAWKYEA